MEHATAGWNDAHGGLPPRPLLFVAVAALTLALALLGLALDGQGERWLASQRTGNQEGPGPGRFPRGVASSGD